MFRTGSYIILQDVMIMENNENNENNVAEPQPAPTPPPKPKLAFKRRKDGSIRALVFKADTESPKIVSVQKVGNIALTFLSALVFIVTVIATLYYVIVLSRAEFHADCTDTIMWANASYESGKVYDPNFKYACFLPFGTNLIMYPLLHFFGLSLTTHLLGMTGFFVIITSCLFLMQMVTGSDIKGACLGTSAFLAITLSSRKLREIFWGHTIYYTLGILFLIVAVMLYFRLKKLSEIKIQLKEQGKHSSLLTFRLTAYVCVFGLFIMLASTDGISALSIFLLPFIAAVAAEYFVDRDNRIVSIKSCKKLIQVLIMAIMAVLGILLNNVWVGDLYAGYQEANSEYSAMASWPDHVKNLPMAWINLLGVKNMAGTPLMKGDGLSNLFFVINAVMLAVIPIVATCYYKRYTKKDMAMRFWVWIHWAVTAIVLLGYICGILSAAEWRLTPIVGTALILSVLFIRWAVANRTSASRMAVLIALPMIIVSFINVFSMLSSPKDAYKDNDLFGIVESLEDYGLENGYATFWNCNSITVVSGSKIKVREVTVDNSGVKKRHYQSSKKWFDEMNDDDEYFLLLNNYEYSVLNENVPDIRDSASQEYSTNVNDNLYHILVFDHSIF